MVYEIDMFPRQHCISQSHSKASMGVEFFLALEMPIGTHQSIIGTAVCQLQRSHLPLWDFKNYTKPKLQSSPPLLRFATSWRRLEQRKLLNFALHVLSSLSAHSSSCGFL